MRQILDYLKRYLKDNFHLGLYITTTIFLAACITLNFIFDFEDGIIDSYTGEWIKWLFMSLNMGFPFLAICGLLYVFDISRSWVKSKEFWLLYFFGG